MFSLRKWIASKMFPPLTVGGNTSNEANTSDNGLSFIRSLSRNLAGGNTFGVQDGIILEYQSSDTFDEPRSTYFSIFYQHYESIRNKKLPINEKLFISEMYQFYYANEELNYVSSELDTFDGRKDTDRCSALVNSLKLAQDKVIGLIFRIMDLVGCERASRDYRLKFPDELLVGEGTESLNSQIWFAAECLAAGSTITNNQAESNYLRPIANNLTTTLDNIRFELRNHTNNLPRIPKISKELIRRLEDLDRLFVSFEYDYVKAMLPIKETIDIESIEELTFLFSETLNYALKKGLITKEDVEGCEPNVMIALPRLSIVRGLLQGYGSVVCKTDYNELCSILRPYHNLLVRFHELLITLDEDEIDFLEQLLSTNHHNLDKASDFIGRKKSPKKDKVVPKVEKKKRNKLLKNKYLSASVDLLMVYNKCEQYDKAHPNGPNGQLVDERFRSLPNIIFTRVDFVPSIKPKVDHALATNDNKPIEVSCEIPSGASSDTFASNESSLPVSSSSNNTFLTSSSSISSSSSASSISMEIDGTNEERMKRSQSASAGNRSSNNEDKKRARPKSSIDPHTSAAGESSGQRLNVPSSPQIELTNQENSIATPMTSFFSDNSLHFDLESVYFDEVTQYRLGPKRVLHQFFVMISKIADQFQTNYASELRNILRTVFYFYELAEKEELERQLGVNKSCLMQPVNVKMGYYSNECSIDYANVEEGIDANEFLVGIDNQINDNLGVLCSTSQPSQQLEQPLNQHFQTTAIECDNTVDSFSPACTCDSKRRRRKSFEETLATSPTIIWRTTSTPNTNSLALTSTSRDRSRGCSSFQHSATRNGSLQNNKCRSLPSNLNRSNEACVHAIYSTKSFDDSSSLNSSVCSLPQSQFTNSTGTTLDDQNCDLPTFIFPTSNGTSPMFPILGNFSNSALSTRNLPLPPVWVPDEVESTCTSCGQVFNLLRRRHHCRRCGHIFCHQCSNHFVALRCFGYAKPVRVCSHCLVMHEQAQAEQQMTNSFSANPNSSFVP